MMNSMRSCRGFTLIELIIVILLIGILSGVLVTILQGPMRGYFDLQRRAELVAVAETALHRMTREIRLALPNSIRLSGDTALEFLRTVDGGRYRDRPPPGTAVLNFNANSDTFEVLGGLLNAAAFSGFTGAGSAACLNSNAACLVVYNTGQPATVAEAIATGTSANAYLGTSGDYDGNIATVRAVATNSLGFDNSDVAGWSFAFESPRQRFQVVDTPVSFVCNLGDGSITRYADYGIQPVQPTPPTGGSANLLIDRVSDCSFSYDPGTATRAALVTLRISITESGEPPITVMQQIHVENQP